MNADLRCLTVLQPFASLIADGHKTIELRPWATSYRGLLVIAAGKKDLTGSPAIGRAWDLLTRNVLDPAPRGRALSLVRFVDIRFAKPEDSEKACYDVELYARERGCRDVHAWILERVCALDLPVRGKQGLWRPDDNLRLHVEDRMRAHHNEVIDRVVDQHRDLLVALAKR